MKTRITTILPLVGAFAVSTAFAQVNYTWIGTANGTNLDTPGNYTTNGINPAVTLPSGLDPSGFAESIIWDGRTTSNLNLTHGTTAWPNIGLGTLGIDFVTTANQTNDVRLATAAGVNRTSGIGWFSIVNNSPHSSLMVGTNWDSTNGNAFELITRPADSGGTVHPLVNNSTAPVILDGSIEWVAGGGEPYTLDFSGPGDFIVNNTLQPDNGAIGPIRLQVDGPGALIWTRAGYRVDGGPSFGGNFCGIGTVSIGSELIVKSAGNFTSPFNPTNPTTINISNGATLVFDAASQSDTIGRNITGSGSLVVSNGTFNLVGTNSYSGGTTVTGGKLVFQGVTTATGDITVANATLGIYDTGTQVTPGTLNLGAGATLEFNNVTNTSTAPLAANTLTSLGTITINVNSGAFTIGQSYPLLSWTSGSPPAVTLGVNSSGNTLSTNGNTIQFNVLAVPLAWTGINNGNWDASTTGNWLQNGNPVLFTDGDIAVFNDTASGTTAVTVNSPVQPASLLVSNSILSYSIASSGGNNIAGATGLSKEGTNTLTLSGGANSYTGPTTIIGGTLSVGGLANGGVPSDIGAADSTSNSLVLIGGALQYTGVAASIDRSFAVGASGGTIDASGSGPLTLNNSSTIVLGGALTLAGTNTDSNTLEATLAGGGGLNKIGGGTWFLSGLNSYSGGTTISGGVLQVGTGANATIGSGDIIDNAALVFNLGSGGLIFSGAISGTGSVTMNGSGLDILAGDNSYSGGTTISAGGTLEIGNSGPTGKLSAGGGIVDNGHLVIDTTGSFSLNGVISGSGTLQAFLVGTLTLNANNTYTGTTLVNTGTLIVNGRNASSSVTIGGTLDGIGGFSGPVTFNPGSFLAPGLSNGSIGTITFSNNLSFAGNLIIETDKSHIQSNDFVAVGGTLTNAGTGTVSVKNLGPVLAVGDKFALFSKPVLNGAALSIAGAGATWQNNLAVDGSITVTSVSGPALNITRTATNMQISWDTSFGNYQLQVQTNAPGVGLTANWVNYSGSSPVTIPIDVTQGSVFFRLAAVTGFSSTTNISVNSGTSGSTTSGSYNETRAVDVTVLSPANLVVRSMTLSGIHGNGEVKAVIYDANTQALIASAQSISSAATVTLPISATLNSGGEYRIGFYAIIGTGDGFLPDAFPYTESSGFLQINSAWESSTDSFPSNTNLEVPLVSLDVAY